MPDHLRPEAMEFLEGIRRPDNLWILRSQARALIGLSQRDVGLLVALLAAMAPHDLHEALQELGWYQEAAEMQAEQEREEARCRQRVQEAIDAGAARALEARLRADPALMEAVLHTADTREGRALLEAEFEITPQRLGVVLRRVRSAPAAGG